LGSHSLFGGFDNIPGGIFDLERGAVRAEAAECEDAGHAAAAKGVLHVGCAKITAGEALSSGGSEMGVLGNGGFDLAGNLTERLPHSAPLAGGEALSADCSPIEAHGLSEHGGRLAEGLMEEIVGASFRIFDEGGESLGIKAGPWILPDVGVEVGAVDEAGGIAGDEHACFEIAVADAFVDEAGGIGVLGVGFLAVFRGAIGGDLVAEGFVLGLVFQVAVAVGFGDDVAAFVGVGVTLMAAAQGVEDAADSAAVVGAADVFDQEVGPGVFLHAGAAAEDEGGDNASGLAFVPYDAAGAIIVGVGVGAAAAVGAFDEADEAVFKVVAVGVGATVRTTGDGAAGTVAVVVVDVRDAAAVAGVGEAGELVEVVVLIIGRDRRRACDGYLFRGAVVGIVVGVGGGDVGGGSGNGFGEEAVDRVVGVADGAVVEAGGVGFRNSEDIAGEVVAVLVVEERHLTTARASGSYLLSGAVERVVRVGFRVAVGGGLLRDVAVEVVGVAGRAARLGHGAEVVERVER